MKKSTFKLLVFYSIGICICIFAFLFFMFPNVEPIENLSTNYSSKKYNRGQRLVNDITACTDCHSELNSNFIGAGGRKFSRDKGYPGTIYSSNITPHNLDKYSDEELALAITSGIMHDKKIIFPVMPYSYYRYISKTDIESMIVYLRNLPRIDTLMPKRDLLLPMKAMLRFYPKPYDPINEPKTDIEKGFYLSVISGCIQCHSQKAFKHPSKAKLTGGRRFNSPIDVSIKIATNLTPHKNGIGNISLSQFIEMFKYEASIEKDSSIMPWKNYKNLTDEEIETIYLYLNSLKPIQTKPEKQN